VFRQKLCLQNAEGPRQSGKRGVCFEFIQGSPCALTTCNSTKTRMTRKQYRARFPRTPSDLARWLRQTQEGRSTFLKVAQGFLDEKCRQCEQALITPPKVLVVVRRLGPLHGVEVFAERGVTVRLEELVDTHDDPVIERLADELLIVKLPRPWRHLPRGRSKSMAFSGWTAEQELQAIDMLRTLEELKQWRAEYT